MVLTGRPPCRFRNAWEGTASPAIRGGDDVRVGWMRCGSAGPLAEPVPLDRRLPGNCFLCVGDLTDVRAASVACAHGGTGSGP